MDIQKLLYINVGLTILTFIVLICIIIYTIINNNNNVINDSFADGEFKPPIINGPPESFPNSLITDDKGNMISSPLTYIIDDTQNAINSTYSNTKEYINKYYSDRYTAAQEKLNTVRDNILKEDDVLKIQLMYTMENQQDERNEYIGLKNSGDNSEIMRREEGNGNIATFKIKLFEPQ